MHQLQTFALYLFDHDRKDGLLLGGILRQKDETGTVFSLLGHGNALKKNKLVGNLQEDTCTVTCLAIGALGSTVT
ncbi:unknown [Prevotella sp. CAG:924]|nr:unknown [Prevotella sp. CAG:924]